MSNMNVAKVVSVVVSVSFFSFGSCHDDPYASKPKIPIETELRSVPKWSPPVGSDFSRLPPYQLDRWPLLPRHQQLVDDQRQASSVADSSNSDPYGIPRPRRPTIQRHLDELKEADAPDVESSIDSGVDVDRQEEVQIPRLSDTCPRVDYMPCVSKQEANRRARQCCERMSEIPAACYHLCHMDVTMPQLFEAHTKRGCDISKFFQPFLVCVGEKKDMRRCCDHKGVTAGDRQGCGQLCNAGGVVVLSQGLLKCGSQMSQIAECYWAAMNP